MNRRLLGGILCAAATGLVATAVMVSYIGFSEAFGSGPPYYGRTTNMDKWTNPVPAILAIDLVCIALAGLLAKLGVRCLRTNSDNA